MFTNESLTTYDTDIAKAIGLEEKRQEEHIELIASENYASPQVISALGTVLNNKYAEGYPHKRYYGGCEHVDAVEEIAIERLKKLFNVSYANVQPHSGSSANSAAFMALIKPHDKVLGMNLAEGGHLTHGSKVNFSGKLYDSCHYGINEEGDIDYNLLEDIAKKEQPKLIIAGFSAYSRFLDWKAFREIADKVGAFLMADIAHVAGLVATDLYPSPVDYADVITSTTHKTLRGPRGGMIISNNEEIGKKLNSAVFPGYQGGPLEHVIAAKAICFKEALEPNFKDYQVQVLKNAKAMEIHLKANGIDIVSNGTDNHLMLISLIKQGITGKALDAALGSANITVNKNSVPNDPQSPFVTSGIRVGTPAITTRGFKEKETTQVADWIVQIVNNIENQDTINRIKQEVLDLCSHFPVYTK